MAAVALCDCVGLRSSENLHSRGVDRNSRMGLILLMVVAVNSCGGVVMVSGRVSVCVRTAVVVVLRW